MPTSRTLLALGCFAIAASAIPSSASSSLEEGCTFDSATAPSCWGDFDLSTNYYKSWPNTGVTREYWFDIINTTQAPDGVEIMTLSVNGSIPGPTIIADWGDDVVVHVRNLMPDNGTSIHFHGIRQHENPQNDGVTSITQCPVAPNDTITYRWKATQYGTSWYHSHYSLQAWSGVFGGMIINGPASAPYDEDLGVLTLTDWYHRTPDELYPTVSLDPNPVNATNGLINGTNTFEGQGSKFNTTFEPGKRHRIRLINTANNALYVFSIANHTLEVIATDFVPIHPYNTTSVRIGAGQRYDLIVTADQPVDNYWLHAVPQESCSPSEEYVYSNVSGIIHYKGAPTAAEPTAFNDTLTDNTCEDEDPSNLVPIVALPVGGNATDFTIDIGFRNNPKNNFFQFLMNKNPLQVSFTYPTLEQVIEGNTTYGVEQQIFAVNGTDDDWVYFILENNSTLPHPVHLHGHDFWVLGAGISDADDGSFNATLDKLQLVNAPRRDTAMVAAYGYVVIAFQTDNPGVWLMHCHVGWHQSQGLGLQVLERISELSVPAADADTIEETCKNWKAYAAARDVETADSGI